VGLPPDLAVEHHPSTVRHVLGSHHRDGPRWVGWFTRPPRVEVAVLADFDGDPAAYGRPDGCRVGG
jgi:hypothetical protein